MNFPNSVGISLSRLSQKRGCTQQMPFFHDCLASRHGVYNLCLQSADVSYIQTEPERTVQITKTALIVIVPSAEEVNRAISPLLNTVQPPPAVFWSPRTLQIHPNHQDWFYTPHWSCHRTWMLQRSSCKLKEKWSFDAVTSFWQFFVG